MVSTINKYLLGLLCLVAAQLCLSANVVVGKLLIQHNLPPLLILTLRFGLGFFIIFSYLVLTNKIKPAINSLKKLSNTDKASIFTQSFLSGFLYNILMLTGVSLTTAAMAGIFISAEPALILILSFILLGEKINKNQIISILIVVFGLLSLNLSKIQTQGISLHLLGDAIVFCAILPEALYTIVAKRFHVKLSPLVFTGMVNFINAILFTICLFLSNNFILLLNLLTSLSLADWVLIFTVLPVSGLMFFLLWNIGLKYSTAQQAGLVTAVVPVGVCLLAFVFLHENIHLSEALGVFMVIVAIGIGSMSSSDADYSPLSEIAYSED